MRRWTNTGKTLIAQIAGTGEIDWPTLKGSLLTGNGSSTVILTVGSDTQVLTADSTAPAGIKWAASAGGTSSPDVLIDGGSASSDTLDIDCGTAI